MANNLPPVFEPRSFPLSEYEAKLFTLVRAVGQANGVVARVAGGWVRDRLLCKPSCDIDIALDTCTGVQFAYNLVEACAEYGVHCGTVTVIATNPAQSKHLETARVKLDGQEIDLVNLRSETYAEFSRIPTTEFGTPLEDAKRRDLTFNAIFYNIMTDTIEDYLGCGLADLRSLPMRARTPLEPEATFLDDPLRILRVIRFAARFGCTVDTDVISAMHSQACTSRLRDIVSSERLCAELAGILAAAHFRTIVPPLLLSVPAAGLYSAVFDTSVQPELLPMAAHVIAHLPEDIRVVDPCITTPEECCLLACMLAPIMSHDTEHALRAVSAPRKTVTLVAAAARAAAFLYRAAFMPTTSGATAGPGLRAVTVYRGLSAAAASPALAVAGAVIAQGCLQAGLVPWLSLTNWERVWMPPTPSDDCVGSLDDVIAQLYSLMERSVYMPLKVDGRQVTATVALPSSVCTGCVIDWMRTGYGIGMFNDANTALEAAKQSQELHELLVEYQNLVKKR